MDTWKRLDDPEMAVVSLQTLFEGRKNERNDDDKDSLKAHPPSKSNRRPSHLTPSDIWESFRQGGQYIVDGRF